MFRPLTACVGATLLVNVSGHGAVTHAKPRQAIDGRIAPWNGTVPDPIPFTNPQNWCAYPNAESKDPRGLSGDNGQACFWFNNVRALSARPFVAALVARRLLRCETDSSWSGLLARAGL